MAGFNQPQRISFSNSAWLIWCCHVAFLMESPHGMAKAPSRWPHLGCGAITETLYRHFRIANSSLGYSVSFWSCFIICLLTGVLSCVTLGDVTTACYRLPFTKWDINQLHMWHRNEMVHTKNCFSFVLDSAAGMWWAESQTGNESVKQLTYGIWLRGRKSLGFKWT